MTKKQKQFIIEKLIPSIMREGGIWFDMNYWKYKTLCPTVMPRGQETVACVSVCCIGGTIEVLLGLPDSQFTKTSTAVSKAIGLTPKQAHGLFFNFELYDHDKRALQKYVWPKRFALQYKRARSRASRAEIACNLLRLVAAKGSKVLLNPDFAK